MNGIGSKGERRSAIAICGEWAEVLEENGWTDAFLVGEEFDDFIEENVTSVSDTLKSIGLVG